MATAQFNEHAKAALAGHLTDALIKSSLRNGSVPSWTGEFAASKKCILKYKGKWLDDFDASLLISEVVGRKLPPEAEKSSNPLLGFMDERAIASVALEVVEFVATLPRSYEVDFPLPRIEIEHEIVFSPYVRLVRTLPAQRNALRGLLLPNARAAEPLANTTYVRVTAQGFVRDEVRQSAIRDALSHMKLFLQVAHVKSAFIRDFSRTEAQIMLDILGAEPTERIHRAIARDVSPNGFEASFVNLGRNLSGYLDSITLHTTRVGLMEPPLRIESVASDLTNLLALPLLLFADSGAEVNCKSIRSALEWDFDANVDDEPISSFIKTCIGLEAALGEDSDEERITERLADRCAYLLHSTAADRARTRKTMREIYQLRSKLVHGAKTRFTDADHQLAFLGQIQLSRVLRKEIQALETWWAAGR